MDVFLDANAIVSAGLETPALRALRGYLDRTRSRLILPAVVLEELLARKRREAEKMRRTFAA